ncbi:MAG: vitamin K epoxide reductase family protein [Mycobacterium sp.]
MSVTAPAAPQPAPVEAAAPGGVVVPRPSAWWILIAGVIGLAASATLLIEKIEMLTNPGYVPSCSINPVLSCGSVMVRPEASAFGFPNPIIGVVSFTLVVVTGVLSVARVPLPRWYWAGLTAGTTLGVVFVHWLVYETLYEIGALCPYCMVVWAVTVPLLVVVAAITLRPLAAHPAARALYHWRWPLVTLWFTAVLLLILVRFWDYWSTLI